VLMDRNTFFTMGESAFDGCSAVTTIAVTEPALAMMSMMDTLEAGVDPETLKQLNGSPTDLGDTTEPSEGGDGDEPPAEPTITEPAREPNLT